MGESLGAEAPNYWFVLCSLIEAFRTLVQLNRAGQGNSECLVRNSELIDFC